MEAEAAGGGRGDVARALLAKHVSLAEADLKHRRWQIASERTGFAIRMLIVAGIALAVAGLAAMAWRAYSRDRLVIEAFSVPADLAQAGATGEAVASRLKDRFAAMNEETISSVIGAEVRDDRASDIKVEIPGAGVSLDDLDRMLRAWLGHEAHVRGEVQRVTSGPEQGALALTVRVTGRPGERLVQADGNLDALINTAAERVYAARSPIRFAQWLGQMGRSEDARAVLTPVAEHGEGSDRIWAHFALSKPDMAGAADRGALLRETLRLDPDFVPALADLGGLEFVRGHLESALAVWRRGATAKLPPNTTPASRRFSAAIMAANVAQATGDGAAGMGIACLAYELTPCTDEQFLQAALLGPAINRGDVGRGDRLPGGLRYLALRHSTDYARRILAQHEPDWAFSARVTTARLSGDWAGVLAAIDAFQKAPKTPNAAPPLPNDSTVWVPLALAKLGRAQEAEALAASKPADCQPCVRVLAMVAAERRDWATTDRLFAEAVRLSPSTPFAEEEWARTLIVRGQAAAAVAKAQAAARKGPKYADAQEALAEALALTGDAKGAAAKFKAAAELAPRWGRLHLKWGEALAKLGKADEARAQWRLAAGLDLTAAERAELTGVMR